MPKGFYELARQGTQGELLATVDLMAHGYEVFKAADPVASTDLIAHYKGRYWRVQVKTGKPELTELKEGRQEIVAWVNVNTRTVRYEPGLPMVSEPMPMPNALSHDAAAANAIERASRMNFERGNHYWVARFHCEFKPCGRPSDRNSCDVREFEIHVKEFPDDPPPVRGPFVCPNCKTPAKLVKVWPSQEYSAMKLREACMDVNGVLNGKRAGCDNDIHMMGAGCASWDELPGWTDCESPIAESN